MQFPLLASFLRASVVPSYEHFLGQVNGQMEAVALTMKVIAKNDPAPATPHHRRAELLDYRVRGQVWQQSLPPRPGAGCGRLDSYRLNRWQHGAEIEPE